MHWPAPSHPHETNHHRPAKTYMYMHTTFHLLPIRYGSPLSFFLLSNVTANGIPQQLTLNYVKAASLNLCNPRFLRSLRSTVPAPSLLRVRSSCSSHCTNPTTWHISTPWPALKPCLHALRHHHQVVEQWRAALSLSCVYQRPRACCACEQSRRSADTSSGQRM